jgi:hypothetical protein
MTAVAGGAGKGVTNMQLAWAAMGQHAKGGQQIACQLLAWRLGVVDPETPTPPDQRTGTRSYSSRKAFASYRPNQGGN